MSPPGGPDRSSPRSSCRCRRVRLPPSRRAPDEAVGQCPIPAACAAPSRCAGCFSPRTVGLRPVRWLAGLATGCRSPGSRVRCASTSLSPRVAERGRCRCPAKDNSDERQPELGDTADLFDVGQAVHGGFDGIGDVTFDFERRSARPWSRPAPGRWSCRARHQSESPARVIHAAGRHERYQRQHQKAIGQRKVDQSGEHKFAVRPKGHVWNGGGSTSGQESVSPSNNSLLSTNTPPSTIFWPAPGRIRRLLRPIRRWSVPA